MIALRETLSNNPDTSLSEQFNLAEKKLAILYRVTESISTKILLCVNVAGSSQKRKGASSQLLCGARHLQLLCYKLDIGLAFVKSGLSGTDIPRGRTRLRLVRPLGMSVPDKPLITQAAADIYNEEIDIKSSSWFAEESTGRGNVCAWKCAGYTCAGARVRAYAQNLQDRVQR